MYKLDQSKTPYFKKIKEYGLSNQTQLDVPGHKLGNINNEFREFVGENVFLIDANAPRGLDNLAKPNGVIKEALELAADAFNADNAYFLVNGTSQGIIAMIMSAVRANEKIIIPRNVHKSAINGLILSGAMPVFIKPHMDSELGIANGIILSELRETILENPDAKAVFVINPTYFGVVSNLKEIVKLAHEYDMMVLVDEAHGAHFGFHEDLPLSAMEAGADMSAVSVHKTLGSLTQTSILLTKGDLVSNNRVRSTLNILQTTSPSSIFMASLDTARSYMALNGREKLDDLIKLASWARDEINKIRGFKAITEDYIYNHKGYGYDPTKIMVKVSDLGITGFDAYNILSKESNVQVELAETNLVLAVLSIATTKEDLENFILGLKNLKKHKKKTEIRQKIRFTYPEVFDRPREAYHAYKKFVKIEDSLNEVSAESIMVYPPGIPLLIPGEIINEDILDDLNFYLDQGSTILSDTKNGYIRVIDQDKTYNKED
ncbi:aminotransferase class I/II-fold pyridoxal phosphate-dependent enzyme [Haploplasma modicum]|uniref:aminotransferase class I/II-fold pyridoxal phosphate-dependent enzyme n=1 Tax=Haploplasma modicum TaxID=2150 RepID=UPI00214C6C4F|nr:aminotransferase class I/II-fold pyridoxal phosphate-dependent enzyme [Haploplasma modicum]MCR1809127.1 aminotransferase class I/II-fold pyridoxal phosphate-dependent enzyme [Haploplasma modicum]